MTQNIVEMLRLEDAPWMHQWEREARVELAHLLEEAAAVIEDLQHWRCVAHTTSEANTALTQENERLRALLSKREG